MHFFVRAARPVARCPWILRRLSELMTVKTRRPTHRPYRLHCTWPKRMAVAPTRMSGLVYPLLYDGVNHRRADNGTAVPPDLHLENNTVQSSEKLRARLHHGMHVAQHLRLRRVCGEAVPRCQWWLECERPHDATRGVPAWSGMCAARPQR